MSKLWKNCSLFFFGTMFVAAFAGGCQSRHISDNLKAEVSHGAKLSGENRSGKKADGEKALSYSVLTSIDSLDPQMINQLDASTVGYHIYEGLVRNEEGEIVPAGASEWKVSKDGLTYTFTLRETCWEDGTPVKAEDYVRGIQRLADEKTESDYGFLVYSIKNGAAVQQGTLKKKKLGVRAAGENQVVIELERKEEDFLSILSMVQFSPVAKKFSKDKDSFGTSKETLLANGPFRVEQWEKGKLVLCKNENYWNAEEVSLDKVVITKRDSIKEIREAYKRGESNLLTTVDPTSEEIEEADFYHDGQFLMVRINTKKKKLANKNFRKALYYAIDQEKLNKQFYEGEQDSTAGYVLPQLLGEEGKSSGYDEEKAKKYMEKAKKNLKWKGEKPWKLTLLCEDSEFRRQTAAFLKKEWERVLGIQVKVKSVSDDERLKLEAKGNFDLVISHWVPDYDRPYAYLENWESDSPYNQGHFSSKDFDKKLEEAAKKSGEERLALLRDAEEILEEEVPAIPLFFRRKALLTGKEVEGIRVYFAGYQYNYIHASIKK